VAYWLTNVLQDAYSDLGQSETFLATTTGTTTTTLNSNYSVREEPPEDSYLLDGTLIVVRDAAGASAAPEGEFGRISAYDAGTYTFTHDALTVATAAGDTVMVAPSLYPLREMIRIVNSSLRELGNILLVDTSITTASGQLEYTYPIALKSKEPARVQIQGVTDDSDANEWKEFGNYYVVPAAPGSTGLFVFKTEYDSGYNVKLWYEGVHPELTAYNSVISETIPPPLIRAMVVERALTWINSKNYGSDKYMVEMLKDARQRLNAVRGEFRIWRPRRRKAIEWPDA